MQYHDLDIPISLLRQRLLDDRNIRRCSREIQRNYLRDIERSANVLGGRRLRLPPSICGWLQVEQQNDDIESNESHRRDRDHAEAGGDLQSSRRIVEQTFVSDEQPIEDLSEGHRQKRHGTQR